VASAKSGAAAGTYRNVPLAYPSHPLKEATISAFHQIMQVGCGQWTEHARLQCKGSARERDELHVGAFRSISAAILLLTRMGGLSWP
jgi:hypothetical protein